MAEVTHYSEPSREEIERLTGPVLVEFGTSWCGHCQALQPDIDRLVEAFPQVRYLWIEDGKGRKLGRSFGVKLWPTLVLLQDGQIREHLVRPSAEATARAFESLAKGTGG